VVKKAMLVYQGGIANVFEVECFNLAPFGRDARRLLQSDFKTCEFLARGMGLAGAVVRTAYCNQAGDIKDAVWSEDRESQPFSEMLHEVKVN
jgi:hypothetical protein